MKDLLTALFTSFLGKCLADELRDWLPWLATVAFVKINCQFGRAARRKVSCKCKSFKRS
jgi:hypothetical protein